MALLNGKTPTEIAADTMETLEDQVLQIAGMQFMQLESVARYLNRDKIQIRGEKFWDKNKDSFLKTTIEKLIEDRFDAILKYQSKKEKDAKLEYFLLLRSKGMSIEDAEKESGIAQLSTA